MSTSQALRIAVEGCGHGTLDAIYASVEKSCEVKGWDGVDLLIICGDFQAVRTHQDLNVTAMPARYRQMGDFHQYYYGTKTAPYLTVFIGGNHEASNHLFELHYGGWAAPNIYYLGTANVVKFGPIKIANTSGVYKRYDYQKPHFERLPYNDSDLRSIYHQRELDIRKLLSYRTQVDIGLSHDWPAGFEWLGDHRSLFARKPYLQAEAQAGDLGSKPSTYVLDRLRPPYWFSAHHHFRYSAYKVHTDVREEVSKPHFQSGTETAAQAPKEEANIRKENIVQMTNPKPNIDQKKLVATNAVSAWNAFKHRVAEQDAADDARDKQELQARIAEQRRTGKHAVAGYNLEENFKAVNVDQSNGTQRRQHQSPVEQPSEAIPQIDGACCSLPKRRRNSSPSDEAQPNAKARLGGQVDGSAPEAIVTNPDAIDISMSDSESDSDQKPLVPQTEQAESDPPSDPPSGGRPLSSITEGESQKSISTFNTSSDAATVGDGSMLSDQQVNESALVAEAASSQPVEHINHAESTHQEDQSATKALKDTNGDGGSGIPDEVRAQLAAMSSTFAPEEKVTKSPDLPFPEDITNKATRFLALSKVETGNSNDFLQLLEVKPHHTEQATSTDSHPQTYELKYDPEWLAITRVFAPELVLGGSSKDKTPADRGETYYRDRIIEEEEWVQDNIVKKNLLTVPKNFVVQTQPQDLVMLSQEERSSMPRELTNPQTSQFCELVGIANPFDISEEERDARMERGPATDGWQPRGGGRGHFRGGRSGHRGGRGGHGGRGRGGPRGGLGRGWN